MINHFYFLNVIICRICRICGPIEDRLQHENVRIHPINPQGIFTNKYPRLSTSPAQLNRTFKINDFNQLNSFSRYLGQKCFLFSFIIGFIAAFSIYFYEKLLNQNRLERNIVCRYFIFSYSSLF